MELIILLVLMGGLYAFMIVPQQRRMRAHQELIRSLREGDVVVTNSGIHGAVAEVEGQVVWLEVAPEVELKIAIGSIAERIEEGDAEEGDDDAADGDDEDDDTDEMADADAE